MGSFPFGAAIDIVSNKTVATPQLAITKGKSPSTDETGVIELSTYGSSNYDDAISPAGLQTPAEAKTPNWDEPSTPKTPNELESSQPPTPKRDDATGVMPSWSYPKMNKYRVLAACLEYFGNGMNDAAPGALIPYIEAWYGIGYAIVSLIWITNAVGFIVAAFASDFMAARLGRAKCLMLSEVFMIAGYTIIACPVPFPAVVVAYLILGFGNALNLALNNVFCANLAHSTVMLGAAHGSYGIGGTVGPIIATALVSHGVHWARFYLIPIGVRLLCLAFTGWSFWNYEKEETTRLNTRLHNIANQQTVQTSKWKVLGTALKNRITIIGALFLFAYQGAEVSVSGWFISYLIEYRNGDPAHVGYVTAGFWAGITLGRFTLTHVAHRVGEKIFVFALTAGVIGFQLMAWLIPNVIGDAVAVAILGLLLGPVYPCAQTIFSRLLPRDIQVFVVGFISSAGSSGGAVVPFLTGLLSQVAGTFVLHPICIGAYSVMIACWAGLPKVAKIKE